MMLLTMRRSVHVEMEEGTKDSNEHDGDGTDLMTFLTLIRPNSWKCDVETAKQKFRRMTKCCRHHWHIGQEFQKYR
jgi:hypothetical protein